MPPVTWRWYLPPGQLIRTEQVDTPADPAAQPQDPTVAALMARVAAVEAKVGILNDSPRAGQVPV